MCRPVIWEEVIEIALEPHRWLTTRSVAWIFILSFKVHAPDWLELPTITCLLVCGSPHKAGHYMAFKHCISFVTDLAAKFGYDWFNLEMLFCSYVIFFLRDQWMIKRKRLALLMSATTAQSCQCWFHSKFWERKSDFSQPKIHKSLKPFWLLNWVSSTQALGILQQV